MRLSVIPILSKPAAKSRAIDQRICNLKHWLATPQTRLESLKLIRSDVQIEGSFLHQYLRRTDRYRPARQMAELTLPSYAVERQPRIKVHQLEIGSIGLFLGDEPESLLRRSIDVPARRRTCEFSDFYRLG